ncbi:hypothetical protein [Pseudarthrobacter sp. ATCC 49987]|uniref:hypothetical protein n=1 Tax=Pseudarthrobacter sp. ATCC 49987 TaxID=2698204 RepID=UPI001369D058|nr:hypothetical protein [Pseudarthrobacter sp. ATCC 49987]
MDGNQGPDEALSVAESGNDELLDLLRTVSRILQDVHQAEDPAGVIEQYRRLEGLNSALGTLRTRLQLAIVLGSVPGVTPGTGSSPMASDALGRLRRAINVIARRDT